MVKPIANKKSGLLKRQAEALIPTNWGKFRMIAYANGSDEWMPHLALIHEKTKMNKRHKIVFHIESLGFSHYIYIKDTKYLIFY